MQLTIDISKLPEGTTPEWVHETIVAAMGSHIGDYEGHIDVTEEKAVVAALVDPLHPERHLEPADLEYLQSLAKGHDVEGWGSWSANQNSRQKLLTFGLAYVRRGDHATPSTCYIAPQGHKALRNL